MKLHRLGNIFLAAALVACNASRAGETPSKAAGDPGAIVSVVGGNVSLGFAGGRLSAAVRLGGFAISASPVTVAQYRDCIAGGRCRTPTAPCANLDGADDDVAQCVGFEGARAYCASVGGDLPTLSQWSLAARGPSVQRFPWGSAAATCDQHPAATPGDASAARGGPAAAQDCGVEKSELVRTGQHPAGASAAGIQDVLLSAGELVRGESESPFSSCKTSDRGCVVFGLAPGAIDAVEAVAPERDAKAPSLRVAHPYGFRCVTSREVG